MVNAPHFQNAGNFLSVGREFPHKVVVTHIQTSIKAAGQGYRIHQAIVQGLAIAPITVQLPAAAIAQHIRQLLRLLLQVNVCSVSFVQNTWKKYTGKFLL